MAQEIKELIEKINEEGIKAAQVKANEIESQAVIKAEEIVKRAKEKTDALLAEARQKALQTEARTRALLGQAARDMLLSVRKEINAMLESLVISETNSALSATLIERVIMELVKTRGEQPKDEPKDENIIITLKKSDLDILEKKFLTRLKEETKQGIILKPSESVRAGFTISFDAGKSCYDFTDKALAEYIGQYLKPKLNEILKSAVTN